MFSTKFIVSLFALSLLAAPGAFAQYKDATDVTRDAVKAKDGEATKDLVNGKNKGKNGSQKDKADVSDEVRKAESSADAATGRREGYTSKQLDRLTNLDAKGAKLDNINAATKSGTCTLCIQVPDAADRSLMEVQERGKVADILNISHVSVELRDIITTKEGARIANNLLKVANADARLQKKLADIKKDMNGTGKQALDEAAGELTKGVFEVADAAGKNNLGSQIPSDMLDKVYDTYLTLIEKPAENATPEQAREVYKGPRNLAKLYKGAQMLIENIAQHNAELFKAQKAGQRLNEKPIALPTIKEAFLVSARKLIEMNHPDWTPEEREKLAREIVLEKGCGAV